MILLDTNVVSEIMRPEPDRMDGLIAAIAASNGAAVATRDSRDFAGLGIELVNPFDLRQS
jgi:predicted nucleic acid-binding protein